MAFYKEALQMYKRAGHAKGHAHVVKCMQNLDKVKYDDKIVVGRRRKCGI